MINITFNYGDNSISTATLTLTERADVGAERINVSSSAQLQAPMFLNFGSHLVFIKSINGGQFEVNPLTEIIAAGTTAKFPPTAKPFAARLSRGENNSLRLSGFYDPGDAAWRTCWHSINFLDSSVFLRVELPGDSLMMIQGMASVNMSLGILPNARCSSASFSFRSISLRNR